MDNLGCHFSRDAKMARRTGRFPQLAHPRGGVNRPSFQRVRQGFVEARSLLMSRRYARNILRPLAITINSLIS